MQAPLIQLLVLAGIAIFLILRLKSVLGTREGFEKPPVTKEQTGAMRPEFEVIEGGPDLDITDHVPEDSEAAKALAAMKRVEPSFNVSDFLGGARGAYEMIILAYDKGELAQIQPFLSEEVYESFVDGVAAREDQGLTIDVNFIGVSEIKLTDATFDANTNEAELTLRFVAELTSAVRDKGGDIVEGSTTEIKRQKDTWAFARTMGSDDPNWFLVSTDA
ncbi:Tim44 domain-containing protein [Sulfitobacter pseudonitzschiae]|uniref:Tim44 domain-containing protein n=1 Tax=Pseudosulfitobacter pseudonitzschiae TaxID=1402135 RepID=A0A9Q2NI65_9RHOB|nr:Tim44/TimA family putative adaptor protein [Pseudosulfitobacter pseudonitzschiae]MBM2290606.1 Tim44 domain-containing protein [Pseudosulfitobacter pseudonitzschiae]MBM2295524.1 Tim44 domain-containing protein [Pseudosulfitobacter pseudonitzschiae]MBM2300436.1 Tim44 domain-containing protein [Pseudosulfitobacter pseudonitzschiae]MBM2310221.1 Tim44 domain-containing protein [Pseudosulfitobacter pseudonitzschiae]MBM2315133.1 Tim44 domain-containing protein [Pseudosulfitobacter pseudonitzschiae|tara:strand:- start:1111 stop:1767 length:657 start_codon:yes stop_codon:yes gene_type:complete